LNVILSVVKLESEVIAGEKATSWHRLLRRNAPT
jgi:hypothetical protein